MSEPGVQSVARAFHILEALARAKRPVALQELSAALGLSKSTVHRLLACLVDLGYAEHLPGGRYRPAQKLAALAPDPHPAARDHLRLVPPSMALKEEIVSYRAECIAAKSAMDGTGGLASAQTFSEYLAAVQAGAREETVRPGHVPATTLCALRPADGRVVGFANVRHRLNRALAERGGHIGYSVRPSERRKGYAKQILRQALEVCRALGIPRALVTCAKDNIASAHPILACGGVLEDERPGADGFVIQRYWVQTE